MGCDWKITLKNFIMKKIIFLLLTVFSTFFYAQENPRIEFNSKSELLVNNQLINNQTSFSKIVELLGTPELIKEHKSGKKSYMYPKLGMALNTYNEKLTMLGLNYNWDGDKNFPNTSFTGVLVIGKTQIDTNTKKDFMKSNSFLTFDNLFLELFAAKTKNNSIIVGFKENKITQLGFEFKPE
jgi:hypothetical protein